MAKAKKKIKISRIVLVISSLILLTLIVMFIVSRSNREKAPSAREQYQIEYNEKYGTDSNNNNE